MSWKFQVPGELFGPGGGISTGWHAGGQGGKSPGKSPVGSVRCVNSSTVAILVAFPTVEPMGFRLCPLHQYVHQVVASISFLRILVGEFPKYPRVNHGCQDSYVDSALQALLHYGQAMDASEDLTPPPAELSISVARWGLGKFTVSCLNLAPCDGFFLGGFLMDLLMLFDFELFFGLFLSCFFGGRWVHL